MTAEIYIEEATTTSDAPETSLEELLAFERLLAWLSSRFANVSGDKLETEIENALRQLLEFLDFDRAHIRRIHCGRLGNNFMFGSQRPSRARIRPARRQPF